MKEMTIIDKKIAELEVLGKVLENLEILKNNYRKYNFETNTYSDYPLTDENGDYDFFAHTYKTQIEFVDKIKAELEKRYL